MNNHFSKSVTNLSSINVSKKPSDQIERANSLKNPPPSSSATQKKSKIGNTRSFSLTRKSRYIDESSGPANLENKTGMDPKLFNRILEVHISKMPMGPGMEEFDKIN
ncbi:unnamed protein product [Caenorhabditis angaria]|uniref:Uncharacterized protein n=1 Tax=Caenorhabditis angaria TaxID=860376 RepID=A0A9P1ITD1_9PELO|nr:unnamed protein product [Caenorhabditis angaria]